MEKRGVRVPEWILSSPPPLFSPSLCAVHTRYAADVDIKVGVRAGPHSRAPARHRVIQAGCPCVCAPASPSAFYVDTEGAHSVDQGILMDVDAHSRVDEGGDGDG
ncbi:hypothetical protein B0H13DRAFT_2355117 [Mycena leptocephala]|nr:hypothetical protein B0H13DRAFT_2355117 [Mycena leptocephala]